MTNSLKHLRPLICAAEEAGWTYDCTTRGHPRLLPPPGARHPETSELLPAVTFANTTASRRSYENDLAKLRRAGVSVPRKNPKKKEG